MFCHNCGKEIPNEVPFCRYCGNSVNQIQRPVVQKYVTSEQPPKQPPITPPVQLPEQQAVTPPVQRYVIDENRKPPKMRDMSKKSGRGIVAVLLTIAVLSLTVTALTLFNIIPSVSEWGIGIGDKKKETAKVEGEGFDSPEDAAMAYITAVNNGDINEIVSTFAIETYVDNFSTKAHLEKYLCYNPTAVYTSIYELSDGSYFDRAIRIEARKANIVSRLYKMIDIYTSDHQCMDIGPLDDDGVDEMMDKIERTDFLSKWEKMEFIKFVDPEVIHKNYYDKRNQDNIKGYEKIYGCDEVVDLCARVKIDGDNYYQFFECCRYNDKWYITTLSGTLSAMAGTQVLYNGLILCDEVP